MARPDRLRIPLDEHRFENVGRLPDGSQFMAYVTGASPTGLKYYSGSDWRTRQRWLAGMHQFDADRAEFIRLPVESAGMPSYEPCWVELRRREQALLHQHAAEWLREVPAWATR